MPHFTQQPLVTLLPLVLNTITVLPRISAPALIVFVAQIYPEIFVENTENYTLMELIFLRDSIHIEDAQIIN